MQFYLQLPLGMSSKRRPLLQSKTFNHKVKCIKGGGSIVQWLAYLLLDQATPGLIPSIPEEFSEEKTDHVAEVI